MSIFLKEKDYIYKYDNQIMETQNVNIITTFNFEDQNQPNRNGGLSLYQQVLAKNFQVIENLLKKLNQIYNHQSEYESSLVLLNEKMQKLEIDNQNIHHEFRTSHFMIDKKLNSIVNEYSNIVQDVSLIKKQLSLDTIAGVNSPADDQQEYQQTNSNPNQNQKNSKISLFREQKRNSILDNSPQNFGRNKVNFRLPQDADNVNGKSFEQQNLGKFLSQIQKQKNNHKIQEIDEFQDQSEIQIKQPQKKNKKIIRRQQNRPSIDLVQFDSKQIESIKNYISNEFIKLSQNSEQLKKIGEIGLDKYIKAQNVQIQEKVKSNQQQIQVFQKQISKKNETMLQEVKSWNKQNIQQLGTIKTYVQEFHKQQQNQFEQLKKNIDQKISVQVFVTHLEAIHKKIQMTIKNFFETFAQKKQTKRVIMFLQKKLNKIMQAEKRFNLQKSIELLDNNTKCLSCNKSVAFQNYHPMFAQVHLAKNGQNQQCRVNGNCEQEMNNASFVQLEKTQRYNNSKQKRVNQNVTKHEIIENVNLTNIYPSGLGKKVAFEDKIAVPFQKSSTYQPQQNMMKSGKIFKEFKKQKNQISLKMWKQKAGTLLKRQNSSIHFRSKSTYKR